MAYSETVSRNGEVTTGTTSDASALATLRTGQRRGATVEVAKDGKVTIIRTALRFGERDGEVIESKTVISLVPTVKQSRLTKTQYEDLSRIRASGTYARLSEDGSIHATMWRIPPSAAKRLLARGLAVAVGNTVRRLMPVDSEYLWNRDAGRPATRAELGLCDCAGPVVANTLRASVEVDWRRLGEEFDREHGWLWPDVKGWRR